ncbi:MAG: hypothetical protein U0694_21580 [Anaerolineae bacterium]
MGCSRSGLRHRHRPAALHLRVLYAEFSPTGRYLIAAADGVYDVTSGQRLYELGQDERLTVQPGADRYLQGVRGL